MGAFIVAGLIVTVTLVVAVIAVWAVSMSDAPGVSSGPGWVLTVGLTAAALVAATHWLPHIGW